MKANALPALQAPEIMRQLLLREEYGFLPPVPEALRFETEETLIPNFCAGNATLNRVVLHMTVNGEPFSFPCYAALPTAPGKYPFFISINFRDCVPDRYMPTEEIIDNGFALLSFCYTDVTSDDGDFTDGLAGAVYGNRPRHPAGAGKIALWAWAAMRVMDYAQTLPYLDLSRASVCGHSRLGKTALLAGALDSRFAYVFSNDSGCSGAALSNGKSGETIADICSRFPYWFCENYQKYADPAIHAPFDQHYLLALTAPRNVYVASASDDSWADPIAEYRCCKAAEPAFGASCLPEQPPAAPAVFHNGKIGYHLRAGMHYFSRTDWNCFMQYIRLHTKQSKTFSSDNMHL